MNQPENKSTYKSSPKLFNYRTWGPKTLKFEGRKAVINSTKNLNNNNLSAAKYHYIRTKEEKKNKRPIFKTTDEEEVRYAFQKALLTYKSNKSNKSIEEIYKLLSIYYKNFINERNKKKYGQFLESREEFKNIFKKYLNKYKPNINYIKYNNNFFKSLNINSKILKNYKKKIDMYKIEQNFLKYENNQKKNINNDSYIITIFNKLYNYYNNLSLQKINELSKNNHEKFYDYLSKFKDIITKKYNNKESIINLLTKKNNLNKITFLRYILNNSKSKFNSQKKYLFKKSNSSNSQRNIENFPNNKMFNSISNALMAYYEKVDKEKAKKGIVDNAISKYKNNSKKMINKLESYYKMRFPKYEEFKLGNLVNRKKILEILDIKTNYKIGISPQNS
jgi:hypothetical protein